MVNLNLARINAASPYAVSLAKGGDCRFTSDSGAIYFVSFIEDEILQSAESYEIVISNPSNKKSPRDTKLRDTILTIIYEFFESSESALLYICDTGDSKQQMRHRLFSYWFNTAPRKDDFAFMSADIRDADGMQNYAAIIIRLDNPYFESVISEFYETVRTLREKPRQ